MSGLSTEKINSRKTVLSIVVALLVAVLSVNLALVSEATTFVGFYIATAVAAAWLVSAKSPLLALSSSFIGWVAAFLITKDALYALLSVSYVPFALTLPYIGLGKLKRSVAIGIGAATVTVGATAALAFITYSRIGDVSLFAVRSSFQFFFKQVSELLYTSFYVSVAGDKVSLIAESNVTGYLNVIICLIPAALCAAITVIGYIAAWIYKKLAEVTDVAKFNTESWTLVPSSVTAVFFIIALITVLIFDTVSIVSLTALNMLIILLPVILLTGLFTSLTPKVTNGIPRPRFFRPLTLIISLFNGVVPFASLCIFYGLFDSFRPSVFKRKPRNNE